MILQLKLKFEQRFYLYLALLFIAQVFVAYGVKFIILALISLILFNCTLKPKKALKPWVFFILTLLHAQYRLPSLNEANFYNEIIKERGSSVFYLDAQVIESIKRPYYGIAKIVCSVNFLERENVKIILEYQDLPWNELFETKVGDILHLEASIEGLLNDNQFYPEPFSYQAYLLRRGFLVKGKVIKVQSVSKNQRVGDAKEDFVKSLVEKYTASPELSLMIAATIGYNYLLDDYTKSIFKTSGLTHLIIVSGYHVAVIFSVLFYIFKRILLLSSSLTSILPIHRLVSILSLIFVYFYSCIVGEDLTTVRALVALLILSLGKIYFKKQDSIKAYFFVMFVILLIWPGSFFEVGFELTFMALMGLIVAAKFTERYCKSRNSLWQFCFKHFCYSLFPAIFTTPVIYFWFNFFSPLTVFYNLIFAEAFCLIFILLPALCFLLIYSGFNWIDPVFSLNLFLGRKFVEFLNFLTF